MFGKTFIYEFLNDENLPQSARIGSPSSGTAEEVTKWMATAWHPDDPARGAKYLRTSVGGHSSVLCLFVPCGTFPDCARREMLWAISVVRWVVQSRRKRSWTPQSCGGVFADDFGK